MSYSLLAFRSSLSMLSIKYLLGLVLVSAYWQGWLMPSLHACRKALHVSQKVHHLIESTDKTVSFLLFLSGLGK